MRQAGEKETLMSIKLLVNHKILCRCRRSGMLFIPQEAVEHGYALRIWVKQKRVQIPVELVMGCDP